jgi:YbbR domain-containing protein
MFRSRKFNLIISFIAAIVIWGFVVTYVNPTAKATVGGVVVEMVDLDALAASGLAVSTAQTHTVDVVVQGSRAQLAEIDAKDLKATIDMKGFAMGPNTVRVSVTVPNGVDVVEIRPERIEITVEERVAVMRPIRVEYAGDFAAGTEPGFIALAPQEVEVSGTREQVESVDYIRALIDVEALGKERLTITADAIPINKAGNPINDLSLSQKMIDITVQLCSVKEVPFKIKVTGEPTEGHAMTKSNIPKTVFIRGAAAKVQDIAEVTGKDISIEGLSESTVFVPELNLPQGVELANKSQDMKVAIQIDAIEQKVFKYTAGQISVTGAAIGYKAAIDTDGLEVTISGTVDQMAAFTAGDLTPYVDLTDVEFKKDIADVAVSFNSDKEYFKIVCVPEKVRVELSKAAKTVANARAPSETAVTGSKL